MGLGFETFLDDISSCFLSEDFDLWRSRMRNPLCIVQHGGTRIIRTESSARQYFQCCVNSVVIQRIDNIIRRPVEFDECDDGAILATFETQILSCGHRVIGPFKSSALLRHGPNGLVAGSLLNVLEFGGARLPSSSPLELSLSNAAREVQEAKKIFH